MAQLEPTTIRANVQKVADGQIAVADLTGAEFGKGVQIYAARSGAEGEVPKFTEVLKVAKADAQLAMGVLSWQSPQSTLADAVTAVKTALRSSHFEQRFNEQLGKIGPDDNLIQIDLKRGVATIESPSDPGRREVVRLRSTDISTPEGRDALRREVSNLAHIAKEDIANPSSMFWRATGWNGPGERFVRYAEDRSKLGLGERVMRYGIDSVNELINEVQHVGRQFTGLRREVGDNLTTMGANVKTLWSRGKELINSVGKTNEATASPTAAEPTVVQNAFKVAGRFFQALKARAASISW